jgi:hypothetical protein
MLAHATYYSALSQPVFIIPLTYNVLYIVNVWSDTSYSLKHITARRRRFLFMPFSIFYGSMSVRIKCHVIHVLRYFSYGPVAKLLGSKQETLFGRSAVHVPNLPMIEHAFLCNL